MSRPAWTCGVMQPGGNLMLDLLPETKALFKMGEGIHGTWYYHLREPSRYVALCGDAVMKTGVPIDSWGFRSDHLNERYCSRCAEKAMALETALRACRVKSA